MARYLVTGGGGFIGSSITEALLARGDSVVIIDNFATGRRENLKGIEAATLVEGDICDEATLRRAMEGVDCVFHEAAIPSVARSVEAPIPSDRTNVGGTVMVLESARRLGVKKVVYAASSSAYGDTPTLPKREDMSTSPLSPYAVSKLAGEHYLRVFAQLYGIETLSLRYFNVFGPRQDPASEYAAVIPRFITKMLRGERPTIFGDGEQTRDFCFIENVLSANLLAAATPGLRGQVVNVACGRRISLNDLVAGINKALGTSIEPIYAEGRAGDVKHSLADISAAKSLIGYEPKVHIEEGLAQTVAHFQRITRT
ncbi:MAG: SDR family oxidoreductase [Deltaproteobacteria bacterium]|nr:SDR family oxidoreductase [Deltaproteobacteria bacterium]